MAQSQSEAEKFTAELVWCINQLELGLERQNPDSRQAAETVKILKILKSTKAPMVKKRQAMRNALGDYRKKMREAEKKSLSSMRHSQFVSPAHQRINSRSRFLRHSHKQQSSRDALNADLNSLHIGDGDTACTPASACSAVNSSESFVQGTSSEQLGQSLPSSSGDCGQTVNNNATASVSHNFHFVRSDNTFCFSFDNPNMIVSNVSNTTEDSEEVSSESVADQKKTDEVPVAKNFYQLEKSDNAFCFNFGGS